MICVEFCRNFCLHVENLHPSLSPCRIYPRWWSKFQLQVLNSTVSTLQLVFNSPVVWWCSANLFSCKLEGGWWAPAIQQNLEFVYKENHYYYTWEFDISLKICKQYRFWTVQSKCVNLQPQLKSELNKSKVIVYLRFTVSTEILSMHSHSQVNHLHLVTDMCVLLVSNVKCVFLLQME